jgi:sec-independent protein translocase protein TatB
MFGINGVEWLVILTVALVLVGPDRLPQIAQSLGRWLRVAKTTVANAKERVDEELKAEGVDVDWRKLDLRQYRPAEMIRNVIVDEMTEPPASAKAATAAAAAAATAPRTTVVFDEEAT